MPELPSRVRQNPAVVVLLAAFAGIALAVAACSGDIEEEASGPWRPRVDAVFVGDEACRACHQDAFEEWRASDHYQAMLPATAENVLGDFDDARFEHFGQVWRFTTRDGAFIVNALDENGELRDFEVAYTFGHRPLQQYLVKGEGGRLQALQVCFDTRPSAAGGQRWFHLYAAEPVPPEDPLHWTRRLFTWNQMCASCHSTGLEKGFDAATASYHTEFAAVNVSCEACHGPGSQHVAWARELGEDSAKGLVVVLAEPDDGAWTIDPATQQPVRTRPLASNVQLDTCAQCHSRRQELHPDPPHAAPYFDGYSPALLHEGLYHADGQMLEEVFVYGSFVQSKMHAAGVRCTDCHHHHTQELLAPGNELCNRCHQPERYDDPAHHFHTPGSEGASCVECHMPHVTYMGVDDRRDHSLRVPRPDLSVELGSPNACNRCHADRDVAWAAQHFREWWGDAPRPEHFGEVFFDARRGLPGVAARLAELASNREQPGIVRATALFELARQQLSRGELATGLAQLADADPLVRHHALALLEVLPPDERVELAAPALDDPTRLVRLEAARVLAPVAGTFDGKRAAAFARAAEELEARLSAGADRADSHVVFGRFLAERGNVDASTAAFRRAFEVEPDHIPSRIELAELLEQRGDVAGAEALLKAARGAATTDDARAVSLQALALFYFRQQRANDGVVQLRAAVRLQPDSADMHYLLGVALHSTDRTPSALEHLRRAHTLEPLEIEFLLGLATIARDAGLVDEALIAARELVRLVPDDPRYRGLVQELEAAPR